MAGTKNQAHSKTAICEDGVKRAVPDFMTLEEFEEFPFREGDRWELIEGETVLSPSPSFPHQHISVVVMIYLEKRMKVLDKPFLISLPIDVEAPETQSYVAPDVVVSQDDDLLDIRPYRGAPKLVVEALSPDSRSRDLDKKHRIYEKRKVPEYWVVDPNNGNLFVFVRNKAGVYDQQSADDSGYTYSPICEQSLRIVPRGRSFQVLTRNPKKS